MSTALAIKSKVENAPTGSLFSIRDFEGSSSAVRTVLSRLESEGELLRLRRGLYWRGLKSRFGVGRPRPADVAVKLAPDRGVGPVGWSASYELGISTQVPSVPEFVVFGPPPKNVPGLTFRTRWNVRRIGLNYWEVALLEVLRSWPKYSEVSWEELTKRVKELRSRRVLDLDRLVHAAEGERFAATRARARSLKQDVERH